MNPSRAIFASQALLADGWAEDVLLAWDDAGRLTRVSSHVTPPANVARAEGPLVPGLPNLHSHAFQRAFAGLAEYRGRADDSFWSWRDLMYRFALAVSPQQLEDIATWLYIEMLQAGYTAVCEFHYLHHDPRGQPYADPAEMSLRLVAAAERAGIGLTLLPVLYQDSGFGGRPPRPDQRRFVNSVDGFVRIVGMLKDRGVAVGVAPHSMRAVGPEALRALLGATDASMPVHIHIAEQRQEVQDCLAWCGQRPVQWLLDHIAVDRRWCLVHATHLDDRELARLARSGATVGLCPTTEANLGDGIFAAAAFDAAGGSWGIGSDSHASVSAGEELRLLEYTQRLTLGRRNVLASATRPQVAERMWSAAVEGGARARGASRGGLAVGETADFVVLDREIASGLDAAQSLASAVFANHGQRAIAEVWVAGRRRVERGHHVLEASAHERFIAARRELMSEV